MCTSIALKTRDFYFGRNLDLEYEFGEQVVVTPRNYPFSFRKAGLLKTHYAMIGMASVAEDYPLYAEAVNEKGLCMAGLNFPDNAWYSPNEDASKINLSPFELIPWLLGNCATVGEAESLLAGLHLIRIPFHEQMPLAPLHWHIADRERSIVLEPVKEGIRIYDNPIGILTNNPPFPFHIANLSQYLNITAAYPENQFSSAAKLQPFGQGMGGIGLPGDFSPASRFVKAAFLKLNSICEKDEDCSVAQFFHLLDAVSMVRGSVITRENKCDITTYSCCVNTEKGIFYYKTYSNNRISAVHMHHEDLDSHALKRFPLNKGQQIAWQN